MTCCVAVICGDGKSLVLVADKMVGIGYVEAEPEIEKLQKVHPRWWVMIAGDDISPVFPIIEFAKSLLASEEFPTAETVLDSIKVAWDRKRKGDAEAMYLKPRGWTLERFNKEGTILPDERELAAKISEYELSLELIVAGFDSEGMAYVATMRGNDNRAVPIRWDIPGFCATGSGGVGAAYMMFYRSIAPSMKTREAMYYALEAKYFGEQASGVSASTDLYVISPVVSIATSEGKEAQSELSVTKLDDEKVIEKILIKKICQSLEPKELRKGHIEILNSIQGLENLPKLKWESKNNKRKPSEEKVT